MSSSQSPSLQDNDPWTEIERFVSDISYPLDIVGVGNPLRQDDAAGIGVATALRRKLDHRGRGVRVHADPTSPERLLSKLIESGHRVVVVDAVDANKPAGTVVCARLSDTKFGYFATHNIPLRLIPGIAPRADEVLLIGIQPGAIDVGEEMSPKVKESVDLVVSALIEALEEGK